MAQQRRPLNPKSISEGTLDLNVPKTPEGSRLAPRRAVSTPEGVEEPEQIARSDKSMSKANAGRKPFMSPCGKKGYVREQYLIKHKRDCDTCKHISKERDDADSRGKHNGSEQLSTEVSGSVEDPGGSRSPILDHGKPRINAHAGWVHATTADGRMTDLEDGIHLEGKLLANHFKKRSDTPLIHERLMEKLNQKLTPTDQQGYVYILSDPMRPNLLRIGRTKSILQRMSQIHYTCGLELGLVKLCQVDNYIRTEGLIHTYILDLCRPYTCANCGSHHGAWFEITKKSARAYVDMWVTFMNRVHPYDPDSKEFRPFYRILVRLAEPLLRKVGTEGLREHWGRILLSATKRTSTSVSEMPETQPWFLIGEGVSKEAAQVSVQHFQGSNAFVDPGMGDGQYAGIFGYWVHERRPPTDAMIGNMKVESQLLRLEGRGEEFAQPADFCPREQVARDFGWQVGLNKFLHEGQPKTPLELTNRGTLGKGSFGVVEEVITRCGQLLVQKRIHVPRKKDQARRYREMIDGEIANLKSLSHAHIVKLVGSYEQRKGIYDLQVCVLMWPSGDEDLEIFLEETYPDAPNDVKELTFKPWMRSWFLCLTSALAYIHSQNMRHEDIKPKNIIRCGGNIYLTDFSSSRKLEDGGVTSTTSPALATRLYAAPEAMLDELGRANRHGFGTDVYSLGLVFLEMVVILQGHSLVDLQASIFMHEHGIREYHRSLRDLDLTSLGESFLRDSLLGLYKSCIQVMLSPERKERPTARQIWFSLLEKTPLSSSNCCALISRTAESTPSSGKGFALELKRP